MQSPPVRRLARVGFRQVQTVGLHAGCEKRIIGNEKAEPSLPPKLRQFTGELGAALAIAVA